MCRVLNCLLWWLKVLLFIVSCCSLFRFRFSVVVASVVCVRCMFSGEVMVCSSSSRLCVFVLVKIEFLLDR